jgi:Flp pilus assembly protein TadB
MVIREIRGTARAMLYQRVRALPTRRRGLGGSMLWTILVVLLVLWLIGLVAHVGGALIHLLLVIAAVVFLVQLLTGRRTVI